MGLRATVAVKGAEIELRDAVAEDVPGLIALLADDQLGEQRDGLRTPEDLERYLLAFRAIDRDPQHLLIAAHTPMGLVGTLQSRARLTELGPLIVRRVSRGAAPIRSTAPPTPCGYRAGPGWPS